MSIAFTRNTVIVLIILTLDCCDIAIDYAVARCGCFVINMDDSKEKDGEGNVRMICVSY